MKVGGQILWNVTPICETSQIYCLMGRRPIKDVLGNHLEDLLFHLVHWLSITLQLRRISQESTNLERKSYLDYSSDTLCTRLEFGRVTYWSQTLRSWRRWTLRKSTQKKTQYERGDFSQRKWRIYFSNRRWTNQNPWSNIDFLGETEGSLPPPHDSLPDAGEAINDFWSMSGSFIYRHHVEPRVKLYSPREESFPIPLKYIDVTRNTHTSLYALLEKKI